MRTGLFVCLFFLSACGPTSAEDRDCSDFATHEAAQLFFEAHGGPGRDRYHLDADRNGVACDSLR